MGSDQDRATVRSRLVTASETAVPRTAAESHSDGSAFDAADERAPGWLFERGDAPEQDEPTSFSPRSRLALGRRGAAVLVLAGLIAAGVAGVAVWRDRPTAQAVPPLPVVEVREPEAVGDEDAGLPAPAVEAEPVGDAQLVVSVVGLVNQAGLVRLPAGSRVADALAAAGGPRPGADVLGLNMAERVDDGDQILVGAMPPDGGPTTVGSARVGPGAAPGSAAGGGGKAAGKVNLNTAGEGELDALPGVGPVTAAAIVSWRQSNGKFTDVEQLGEVDGIGPARLAKLRDLVTL
ncbi:ComEA family DNA-binding protein [Prescottella equi]|uniref:ComEA family DNA-binding protein n=1 Tax=Rhodococcus hoagii TaxID=43767 RepID=UPI000A0F6C45|nr:ComEA family DNA-binding protein [Prescottella equi]NKR26424.1 ComEA family DNA-binding protein [Prescottella equi]NKR60526.1 ComEA family DNA-binding protein [Prescottella equi]ORJ96882.1 competence protein ComEA [Prescottella equi]